MSTQALFEYRPVSSDDYLKELFHVPCGGRASSIADGDVQASYCDSCRTLDVQASTALVTVFRWLGTHESASIGGTTSFDEFHQVDPRSYPPIDHPHLRIWRFAYAVTSTTPVAVEDGGAPGEVEVNDEDRIVLVMLLSEQLPDSIMTPDGPYRVDYDHYPLCDDVLSLASSCGMYVHPNAAGVLSCPDHGDAISRIDPEDYQEGVEE